MGVLENPGFWKLASMIVTALITAAYGHKQIKQSKEDRIDDAKRLAQTCYLMAESLAALGKIKETPLGTLAQMKESRAISEFQEAWKPLHGAMTDGDLAVAKSVFRQWAGLNFGPDGTMRGSEDSD